MASWNKMYLIIIILSLHATSGLEHVTCKGPFEPPRLVEIRTTASGDLRNPINEVNATIEFESDQSVKARWVYEGSMAMYKEATENDEYFRKFAQVRGSRHIFQLAYKLRGRQNVRSIRQAMNQVLMWIEVTHACNSITYYLSWTQLDVMARFPQQAVLPTLTEIPRRRIITADDRVRKLKAGYTIGRNPSPPKLTPLCRQTFQRKNGQLSLTQIPFLQNNVNASGIREDANITYSTCNIRLETDQEAMFVFFAAYFDFPIDSDPSVFSPSSFSVYIRTEMRKPGINRPAVLVQLVHEDVVRTKNRVPVLPSRANVTMFYCFAEAEERPDIAVAKVGISGDVELAPAIYYSRDWQSFSVAKFITTSPSFSEEDDYVCSASSGTEVTRQRFKIIRYLPVEITPGDSDNDISVEDIEVHRQLNLTCEVTGFPLPELTFMWKTRSVVYSNPTKTSRGEYVTEEENQGLIQDSDLYKSTTTTDEDKVKGNLIVKDIGRVFQTLPRVYLNETYMEIVYFFQINCRAFNEFSNERRQITSYFNLPD